MRLLASAILVVVALAGDGTASAQTYDPNYPVCMHVYGDQLGERMDCIFPSLAQCAASARALPAICLMNPYYSRAGKKGQKPGNRS